MSSKRKVITSIFFMAFSITILQYFIYAGFEFNNPFFIWWGITLQSDFISGDLFIRILSTFLLLNIIGKTFTDVTQTNAPYILMRDNRDHFFLRRQLHILGHCILYYFFVYIVTIGIHTVIRHSVITIEDIKLEVFNFILHSLFTYMILLSYCILSLFYKTYNIQIILIVIDTVSVLLAATILSNYKEYTYFVKYILAAHSISIYHRISEVNCEEIYAYIPLSQNGIYNITSATLFLVLIMGLMFYGSKKMEKVDYFNRG